LLVLKICLPLLACLWAAALTGQTPDRDLPRYPTEWEKQLLGKDLPGVPSAPESAEPPGVPVRSMGEWEELQALLVTWRSQPTILTEIVRHAREECRVIVCCNNQATVSQARSTLLAAGVDTMNVSFLEVPNNSIWIRDYGPNCVYANGVDSLLLVDWRYNRPARPLDDALPQGVADFLGLPLFGTTEAPADLVNTGGNFMSDGLGTAFSSSLILEENEPGNPYGVSAKTEAQIDGILQDYMGIQRYIKMDKLPYDVIHHIDMHMKLLDEETLLVGRYPDGVADGPQIEANIQYVLSNFQSVFGTPYKVLRIPMPPQNGLYPNNGGHYRTFANAVFVNKTVLVPFYELQFDTTAQRIWEEALPGYRIQGINCNSIIPSLGAIHCITKEVGVRDPLHIVHQELPCMDNNAWPLGYPVWANLNHRSGIAEAKIHYTTDLSAPWQSVDLPAYLNDDTTWTHKGYIPLQPAQQTVHYYIEATANSGKTLTRPLPAPQGWWQFCTQEIVDAPEPEASEAALRPIYPNPARAITVVPLHCPRKTNGSLRVYNALGQEVQRLFQGEFPAGPSNHFLDAGAYVPGTYFVALQTDSGTQLQKLLVR
jgi:agmatine/peptidylarginine deiminase